MPQFILTVDQGTTSSRALLINAHGAIHSAAQREFTQLFPQPGWVEHDPQEIWRTTLQVMREAMDRADATAGDIAAIGITNQRETTVMWERATGRPVANAIVWQDRRTARLCEQLRSAGLEPLVQERTGLLIDAYFSGTKVKWLLDNVPGLRARAVSGEIAFGTIDSWLLWNLTGGKVYATDVTNASRTMLFGIHSLQWDQQLLQALDIPPQVLPEVRPSSGIFGVTQANLLGRELPIAGIAGDQQAALFGQACYRSGMAKNTYGTGSFMLMNTGTQAVPSRAKLLTTIAWQLGTSPPEYALEGSVFITGAAVQWLRDGLGIIATASESETLARSIPSNDGVYFVPALTGLGAPYWDPHARGTLVGITRGTTRAHLARATLEAICYQTRDVLEAMTRDSGIHLAELRADGGAVDNGFLMQFQADVLGVPVVVPKASETTALGAAYLAGLACGFWKSTDDLQRTWRESRRYEPAMSATHRDALYERWQEAVRRASEWART